MKILMLVNWEINYLGQDNASVQPPDKVIVGGKYWFFRHWPEKDLRVDVVDWCRSRIMNYFERRMFKCYIKQALHVLERLDAYDVIISHGAQSSVVLSFLRSLMGRKKPPHFVIDVGSFNGGRENRLETLPIEFAARSLSGIVYHCRIQEQYYVKHFRHLLKNTEFIPLGVDTEFFSPIDLKKGNYVIAFGYRKRDYRTLCQAWESLSPTGVSLHIVGMETLQALGVERLSNNICISGVVPIDILKEKIARARFVILPLPHFDYSYGQMSLLQSMSMGKAVIVTRTPSVIDYVHDNVNAVFVRPHDTNDMKEKMDDLLTHPDRVERFERAARLTVLKDFGEAKMARRIFCFVRRHCAAERRRQPALAPVPIRKLNGLRQ